MKKVYISKVACETALGSGPDRLWEQLLAGATGIRPVDRFNCDNYLSGLGAAIDGLSASGDGSLHDDLLARIAGQIGEVPRNSRLLVASTKGELDRLEKAGRSKTEIPAALLFEPLLTKIASRFGIDDPGTNINAACASSTIALARGAALIAHGAADAVLVYAADLMSEFVFSGFSALQALSTDIARPFDSNRSGLNLGEAGAALLLTANEPTGGPPLGIIAGWGAANDAHHVTAPARDGSGLILACRQALAQAGIEPGQVAAINGHGTGTVYNDAMELTAFAALFGPDLRPLHGMKGSLGHTLGAAGATEAIACCYALAQQQIPGTAGCLSPEESGNGRVSTANQAINGDYLLSTNSGFGGINGALIIQGVL